MPKNGPIWASFLQAETCGQIVTLRSQKLLENAKIQKFKCDIFGNFQTVWGLYVKKNNQTILKIFGVKVVICKEIY